MIQPLPSDVDTEAMCGVPHHLEVKKAVFNIAADSAPGPDGFTTLFYQHCWDCVGDDVTAAVSEFFNGAYMPRSFTATMIVLLPKKERPMTWADFRPISLCNVSNKIISKILAGRLAPVMPVATSPNQSGFVQGRLLSDNVLLAQEMIQDLHKGAPSPNIAIKLDMAKEYDRVQWPFLIKILEKMGFSSKWRSLIERTINSNWFSILINGVPGGFFKSSRGLRQGDPLSPALFVIAAEYLSRLLDKTILGNKDMKFSTTRKAPGVSHLAYADDIIIFTKASRPSLCKVIKCIEHYEAASGQKVNMRKSHFYLEEKFRGWGRRITRMSGFMQGTLPFEYLGVPIFRGIKRTSMFLFLQEKISRRIHTWSHKYLSFGGRLALIKSTLGALPLHIFQVIEPTNAVLKQIESIIARFFWASNCDNRKTHWIGWEQVCHPIDEGGLGVRRFRDMVTAFSMKLWWRFRERGSLWAEFMFKKYSHSSSPSEVRLLKRSSPTWRRMVRVRMKTQLQMRWVIGEGAAEFWDDTWLADQPLREFCQSTNALPRKLVRDFWRDNNWDEEKLRTTTSLFGIPGEVVEKILQIPIDRAGKDSIRWTPTPHGNFSTSSAWELTRHHQETMEVFGIIWSPAISPSMSIFVWRLIFNRIPVDAKLQWRNIQLASKCRCCKSPTIETREHLFVQGRAATKIWRYFANWFRDAPPFPNNATDMEQRIRWWQSGMGRGKGDHACNIIPCLILWFIWTERNNVIHQGVTFSWKMIIERIQNHLEWVIFERKMEEKHWTGATPGVRFKFPQSRKNGASHVAIIRWSPPPSGWVKLNTDGSWMETNGIAGGGGIIRNEHGNILEGFSVGTNAHSGLEAELYALLQGIYVARRHGENIWIEVDAREVVCMIERGDRGAAQYRHTLIEIRNILRGCPYKISHISREGNKVADFLAKLGGGDRYDLTFKQEDAPSFVKALVIMDQRGIPNIRMQDGD